MKKTIFTLMALLSMQYLSFAQSTKVFEGQPRALSEFQEKQLNEEIGDFIVFDFPLDEFNEFLKKNASTEPATFHFKIGQNIDWKISMQKNQIRSFDMIQNRSSNQGVNDVKLSHSIHTYKGIVHDSSKNWIRWYVSDHKFMGGIVINNQMYSIKPLKKYFSDSRLAQTFVISTRGEINSKSNSTTSKNDDDEILKSLTTPPTSWLQIAAEVDFEFYDKYNQDEVEVIFTLDYRLNMIDGVYQNHFGLAIEYSYINIWETNNDNYNGDKNELNVQLKGHWFKNNRCIIRDAVHLFTGRQDFGGVQGAVNAIDQKSICGCDNYDGAYMAFGDKNGCAYGWTSDLREEDSWYTTAHELGHNLGAVHDCSDIMCSSEDCSCGDPVDFFSGGSGGNTSKINSHLGGVNTNYTSLPSDAVEHPEFNNNECLTEPTQAEKDHNALVQQEKQLLEDYGFTNGFALPTASGISTYNFGISELTSIPSVRINDGGLLRINGVGPTGFLDGPNTNQEVFNAATARCGSDIIIENGGEMILGNENENVNISRKANVRINKYSKILVKNGGTLKLARGSKLMIDERAQLVLEEGSKVRLWWSESAIEINGRMVLYGEIDFGGSGFFQFEPKHQLNFVGNADFILHGQGDRFIRLSEGTTLDIGNKILDIKNGIIEYEQESQIRIGEGGSLKAFRIAFNDINNGLGTYGINADGAKKIDFSLCHFNDLFVGVYAHDLAENGLVKTAACQFNNCIIGMTAFDYPEFKIQQTIFNADEAGLDAVWIEEMALLNMVNCNVNGYDNGQINTPGGAIKLSDVDEATLLGTHLSNNIFGVTLSNVPHFEMIGGSIVHTNAITDTPENGTIGIHAPSSGFTNNYTNIILGSGTNIQSYDKGIFIASGGIADNDLYGMVTMDCAKLINNNQGITGQDIPLNIDAFEHCECTDITDANPNTFVHNLGNNSNQILFDICYDELSDNINYISAAANYWGGGVPQEDIDYVFDVSNNTSSCNATNDLVMEIDGFTSFPPVNCNNGTKPPKDRDKKYLDDTTLIETKVIVYPNPARNEVVINWNKTIEEGNIKLISINGKIFYESTLLKLSQIEINTSQIPRGVYTIQITGDDFNSTHKLILD